MPRRLLPLALALAIAALPFLPTAPLAANAQAVPTATPMPMNPYADPPDCGLSQVAFCDSFDTPSPGGRAGDLDDRKWSFARLNQAVNIGQGSVNTISPTDAMFCQTPISGVLPPKDSFFCDGTDGKDMTLADSEHMHWMTAMNDGGFYAVMGGRIRQPFDFAGRTGTIGFGVDAVTRGSHEWWPQVVIADQPIPAADTLHPSTDPAPRNAVLIAFDEACPTSIQTQDAPATGPDVMLIRDYQETDLGLGSNPQCMATRRDDANRIKIDVSTTAIQVWGTDAGSDQFKLLATYSGLNLPFTRGYVSFEQAQYSAEKGGGEGEHTYHWHAIGFDGPVLPTPRAYEVPDPQTPYPASKGGGVNDGWYVSAQGTHTGAGWPWTLVPALTIPGVDPAGATQAVLSFDTMGGTAANPIRFRLNGGDWTTVTTPPVSETGAWTGFAVAVPLGALTAGDNAVQFAAASDTALANVELELETGAPLSGLDATTADNASPTATASPTAAPTVSPTPTATATAAPSSTPTAAPTATTAPTSTPTLSPTPTTAPSGTPTPAPTATSTPTPLPAQAVGFIAGLHWACTSHDGGQTYECVRP